MPTKSTTGDEARASTTGYRAHASTTGQWAHASTTGFGARASTTGFGARASTTGDEAHASTTGHRARASTTGSGARASTTGDEAHASTTGFGAHASTTGDEAHASSMYGAAESAHGVAIGRYVRLTKTSNAAVILPEPGYRPHIVATDDGWPLNTWITMQDGHIVCRPDILLMDDGRGYQLKVVNGRYVAGCRNFGYEQAVEHWSDPDHEAPESAARLLAAVQHHHETGEPS